MQKQEVWAIHADRISAFFASQDDALQTSAEEFLFSGCHVRLSPLSDRKLGGLAFPQCAVMFEGEETAVEPIYRRFYLRFLSAGG